MDEQTLEQMWEQYAKALPQEVSMVQYIETRRAFYGGFAAMLGALTIVCQFPEEKASEAIKALDGELEKFIDQVNTKEETLYAAQYIHKRRAKANEENVSDIIGPISINKKGGNA